MTGFSNPKERWSQRFETKEYIFGEIPNKYLVSQRSQLKSGKVLAIADGEGRNGVWLAEQGLQVDSFDFIESAVTKAQKLASSRGVEVNAMCSDWQSFDWKPSEYDNVVGIFFQFVEPEGRAEIFKKIDQVLKPGGVLILQGYSTKQMDYNTGGPGKIDHLYDADLLRNSFKNYEVIDLQVYEAEIHEGTAHKGMSGLVGYVARKPK
ncbi:MAG: tRNA (cmo5U34)-methyltransferase [Pseudomonadota bacterium]|jgi:cyclopropane fatty-acyl-phospholipid synthase-like methyltransferase